MLPTSRNTPEHAEDIERGEIENSQDWIAEVIELLRTTTTHDFSVYRADALERRMHSRMDVLTGGDSRKYLEILRSDIQERGILVGHLLNSATPFFQNPRELDYISDNIIPELLSGRGPDQVVRAWVPGCGTGEEALTLVMLILEQISAGHAGVKLQVFGTDVSSDAITTAREGWYPATIAADLTPSRLTRFFSPARGGFKVARELRRAIIFAEHNVLVDPPFVRLDLLVCRNVTLHLRPEAQQKVASQFHRALRAGGKLVLGNTESLGPFAGRFEAVSESARVYRATVPGRRGSAASTDGGEGAETFSDHPPAVRPVVRLADRQAALAEMSRRLVIEHYAPATILINAKFECLYRMGPTDKYLNSASEQAGNDFIAMLQPALRSKARSAIEQAFQANTLIVVAANTLDEAGAATWFSLNAQPVQNDGEGLLLISFIDIPDPTNSRLRQSSDPSPQIALLEQELQETRTELAVGMRIIEQLTEAYEERSIEAALLLEEQAAVSEELKLANAEIEYVNDDIKKRNELLVSELNKEKSKNRDLRQLFKGVDVAAIILDRNLKVRYFTPAMRALFNLIAKDIGRPLSDIHAQIADPTLLADARFVVENASPIAKEIEVRPGVWLDRRVFPYFSEDHSVVGVLITFVEVTERKRTSLALEVARQEIDVANATTSRFIAVASHDLRQPLQTLILLLGVLGKDARSEAEQKLMTLLDQTCSAMSGMLDALLEIDQIASGKVHPKVMAVAVDELFSRLHDEFAYHALARGLTLRVVPSKLTISTDPRLFEQMLRNLLSNALKYTKSGKVLLGCRRRDDRLSIEVWDTGVGIPDTELPTIFDEYHQLDNAAEERTRGFGLGLSIVRRLADLLGHDVSVCSVVGKGSVFSTEIKLSSQPKSLPVMPQADFLENLPRTGSILVVEDDPDIRHGLELFLTGEGHLVSSAADGAAALESAARSAIKPDLIVAAHHLARGIDGFGIAEQLRDHFHHRIPVVILGDEAPADQPPTETVGDMLRVSKPVKPRELTEMIQNLLPAALPGSEPPDAKIDRERNVIFVVDDDRLVRDGIKRVLNEDGWTVEDFASAEAFLESVQAGREGCLLVDASLPAGISGLELLRLLDAEGRRLPAVMITGRGDLTIGVQAMKAGAFDVIEKPLSRDALLAAVANALSSAEPAHPSEPAAAAADQATLDLAAMLTTREVQILKLVLAGNPSKIIARNLGISQRTVENHRASIMRKTGAKSLPTLARLAMGAL